MLLPQHTFARSDMYFALVGSAHAFIPGLIQKITETILSSCGVNTLNKEKEEPWSRETEID